MHAVILAGGAGTRLRPLTYARRKELVPLLNRPLLEYRLLNLREHGVTDVVLACASRMRELEEHFGDGRGLGVNVDYSYEDRPLGSGRAVKEAARLVGATGAIVVCNGDILTNVDLTAMIEQHRETRATLSISLARVHEPWHFGVVEVDEDLRISRFVEKPARGEEPSNLINAGTWIWEPAVFDRIPDDDLAVRDGFSERVLFPSVIQDGLRVQGFEEDLWVDVGSPERYFLATQLLLERTAMQLGAEVMVLEGATVDERAAIAGRVLVAAGAEILSGVRIIGPSVVGEGCTIATDATIDHSVLWENVRIGERAEIVGSIVGGGATIGAGARIMDAVIADGAKVSAGAQLRAGTHVMPGELA